MKTIGKQKILLPKDVDMQKWAVVACDQFTAEPKYWKALEDFVGNSPSTLKLTLPEIYLNETKKRISKINSTMQEYLDNGIFEEKDCFVLVEREVENGGKRIGLVLSVDLEDYEWTRTNVPIRATEDTIIERLPARVKIREGASIELPHILLLIDDEKREIIEKLYQNKDKLKKLYDFELNMKGGHIRGYEIERNEELLKEFQDLLSENRQIEKYGKDAGILFAVGDGNQSLATAKKCWNEIKESLSEEEKQNHPARFALVEVVNIYDEAMLFEPIHRVVFNSDEKFVRALEENLQGEGKLKIISAHGDKFISCPLKSSETISAVQGFIEKYIKSNNIEVDYIHGEDHLREIIKENENSLGILLPTFAKKELFNYVINIGNLPKKAFSIGGPEYKKYYLEAKKIR